MLFRSSAQRFNISPVIDKLMAPSPKPQPAGEPVRFAVFNVALTDGVIRYTDRVLKQEHVIDQLHLGVPFVSNLPSQIDVEVVPELKARIDGSPLSLQGKVLPFPFLFQRGACPVAVFARRFLPSRSHRHRQA